MLFLSDLDGTLMDSNGEITIEDVEAIHQWTQKHGFGFVTGRDRAFCVALASKYQLSCEYMITDNGANAYYKDENVYSSLIELSEGIQMCKAILVYRWIYSIQMNLAIAIIQLRVMVKNAFIFLKRNSPV